MKFQMTESNSSSGGFAGRWRLLLCALIVAACVSSSLAVRPQGDGPQASGMKELITTASNVRVRAEAQASGAEVSRLPLGIVVRQLEQSTSKEKIGTTEAYWYRIAAPGGVEGWVFGALLAPFDAARREDIYLRLADERLKLDGVSFSDGVDLVKFLERAVRETRRNASAEFELRHLLALQKSLAAIPVSKQEDPPYQPWIKAQGGQVVYSEPAGQWYVRAESFWNLERKYRSLPVAERIAWEASQIPLPGECEGYLPCHLDYEAQTAGSYLKLYPRGAHAAKAVDTISEQFMQVLEDFKAGNNTYDVPKEERAAFQKQIVEFRAVLSRVSNPKAALAVKQLDQIARRFK